MGQTTRSGVEAGRQEVRVNRTTRSEVAIGERELTVEQTTRSEVVEVGGQELIAEQTTCKEVVEVGGQELIVEQTTCNEVVEVGKQELIVEQTTCSEVEVREQELSKPKLMRQETLGMGRTENSRFRNKNFEFTDDDPVQMKVFTPIMNLVVKTTYESDEAFKAAMEKRRRGLKLKRSEEAEEGLNFTLHVTQTHINLVAKALGQVVQEEPTTATRSLTSLVKQAPGKPGVVELDPNVAYQKQQVRRVGIEETNLHSTGENEFLTNRIEADEFSLSVTEDHIDPLRASFANAMLPSTTEGKIMDVAMDLSFAPVSEMVSFEPVNAKVCFEPVNERMSFEPVSERKKMKKQESSSWTEGANLTDTLFLKSRIHALNSMVNKVCGELRIVRTTAETQDEEVSEKVEQKEETEVQLNSIRLQQFCQLVTGVLHPDHHKERCIDDRVCERDCVHPHVVYVHLEEYDVDAALDGPDSAELLHATGLVCRALHNNMDMTERKRPGAEETEESAKVVEFVQDSKLSGRVSVFDKLVRRALQTESVDRCASRKKL